MNKHPDDTKPILGRWLGVSHIVLGALCYWILSEKEKVPPQTTVQHLTADEPIDTYAPYRIRDYHGSLEYVLGSEDFGTSLYGYELFVNDYEEGVVKGDPNEE